MDVNQLLVYSFIDANSLLFLVAICKPPFFIFYLIIRSKGRCLDLCCILRTGLGELLAKNAFVASNTLDLTPIREGARQTILLLDFSDLQRLEEPRIWRLSLGSVRQTRPKIWRQIVCRTPNTVSHATNDFMRNRLSHGQLFQLTPELPGICIRCFWRSIFMDHLFAFKIFNSR